ncbi:MAG: GNAT family N-acetyltransferase [Bacilli bacterium]|nr:GNAT family N-acetyltransferase [Bacilli bacterium]
MNIRRINDNEIKLALDLVWDVFLKFEAKDYIDEGIQLFKDSIDNKDFISKMEFFGAFLNNKLVGVISTRDKCHISLLFVNEEFHKQGIGKSLINYILKFNEQNFITVNSSIYGKSFYEHLGFVCLSNEQNVKGLRFYPMKKDL